MANPPNLRHSNLLKTLCDDKLLTDPYRCRYPNRIDFTYTPSASVKKNRSRLDFFIVSQSLMEFLNNVSIKPAAQNKLFDHKAITLDFVRKKRIIAPPTISKHILKDPEL
jgi:exonuclease III